MSESWVRTIDIVTETGDLTQLYPATCTPGVNPAAATLGQWIRKPQNGALHSLQVMPDGSNGATVEFWDINGLDVGADVSSGETITNAQLVAAQAQGLARLIYKNEFTSTVGSGVANAAGVYRTILRGIAVRIWNDAPAGEATVNLVVDYGYVKTQSLGA